MACSWAIAPVCAQDISQIAKSDPLIITGSIGTNNTYFHSSAGLGYMSPLSNSFFANLNFNIYGFSMPFSIYFSNDNLNFSYPQFSFNLSPSYKNFTAHIGQSSMPFSQYVLNMSFNGVGLEWRDKQFRASAFYGVLRRAVNDNPDDPTARIPQYRRYGWGISAGYSKGGNSIDLYFLRAYDSESSIDERWRTRVRPQENLVLGLKGQLSYKNFLSLAANVATSAFTADRESQQVMTDEARRFDKIFETRYTSRLRFAGDATLGLTLKGFNASIFYKYIQPDYVSLGTYYTSNNYHTLGLSAGTTLLRRLTLSASFSGQEDNLAKQQLYTTRGYVYNAMASLRISDRMNVTAMYNGYLQSQGDGTAQVNDTTEIHRVLHSFSLVPTYNLPGELFDHTISLSANYTENRDLNKFSVGQTDVEDARPGCVLQPQCEALGDQFHLLTEPPKHQGLQFGVLLRRGFDLHGTLLPQGEEPQHVGHGVAQLQRGAPPLQEPLHGRGPVGELHPQEIPLVQPRSLLQPVWRRQSGEDEEHARQPRREADVQLPLHLHAPPSECEEEG